MESHVELNSSRARTSDNLDVYKQAKQTNRQTLARRSSQGDARPLRPKALYLRREREKSTDGKSFRFSCELLRSQSRSTAGLFCTRAFVHVCATNRIEIEAASQTRREIFQTNERTNERILCKEKKVEIDSPAVEKPSLSCGSELNSDNIYSH